MYESDMRDSKKITVYPGNILRIKSNLLILYENSRYSQVYNRLSSSLDMSAPDHFINESEILISVHRIKGKPFEKLCIINAVKNQKSLKNPTIEIASKFILQNLPNLRSENPFYKISFNLTDMQEAGTLKTLIDRILGSVPAHVFLVGTSLNINNMLSCLNQSGHLFTSSAISIPDVLSGFFSAITCKFCKKIDKNFSIKRDSNEIYCSLCAPLYMANTKSLFVKSCIENLRETCYCKATFSIRDKDRHLSVCTTAVFYCDQCDYYAGQYDFVKHYVMNHTKQIVDNMARVLDKIPKKDMKKQCNVCGTFNETNSSCSRCLIKELLSKRAGRNN